MELSLPKERAARQAYLRQTFPECGGADAAILGTRIAALDVLRSVNPSQYAATRNHLRGAVSRLSPYFRHGQLSLHDAAQFAIEKSGKAAYKFVFELAWRDFWRRVWWQKGGAIEQDIETAKVQLGDAPLPNDIREGETGLACMDAFVDELLTTGYVHNHARMWFAAYVVHHRKVSWKAVADWYYTELLDGDRASNHLSWQWIASTFSAKPYFFNRENLERFTDGEHCATCRAECPFDASYEALEIKLFSGIGATR